MLVTSSGDLLSWLERLLCTQEVKGSTPLFSTESVRTQFFDILERWKNIFHNNEQKQKLYKCFTTLMISE